MKRKLHYFAAVLVALSLWPALSRAQFWFDNFEALPTGATRTAEENGGTSSSYFKLTDGTGLNPLNPFTGKQGTYYWAGEDHNGPSTGFAASGTASSTSGPELQIEWTGINITGKTNLSFKGLFAAASNNEPWDNNIACASGVAASHADYIIVEYKINTGSYQPLIRFFNRGSAANGVDKYLFEDTDGNGCGDGTQLTNAFAEFTKPISGTGTTLSLRIRVFSEGLNEKWGIDDFRVFGDAANTAPTASSVTHTGTLKEGQTLTGTYSYSDPESNAESGSTFKWYRSDNASGLNKAAIASATSATYLLAMADIGKHISFEVTPRDGALNGTAVESPLRGPVLANVLPVGFLGLAAKVEGAGVRLDWRTATETGNKGFVLWRGDGAGAWKVLSEVAGKGGVGIGAAYSFIDRTPLSGDNYYRLVQVDVDGRENELETKVVNFSLAGTGVTVYPNPVTDKVTIGFEAGKYSAAKLLGPDGKTIKTWTLSKNASNLQTTLHGLPKGIYLIGLRSGEGWTYGKIIKN